MVSTDASIHKRVGVSARPSAEDAKSPGGDDAPGGAAVPGSSVQQVIVTLLKSPLIATSPPLMNKPSRTSELPCSPVMTHVFTAPGGLAGRRRTRGRCSLAAQIVSAAPA